MGMFVNESVDGLSFAHFICFRKQGTGLRELQGWMGDDGLMKFLSLFPSLYLRTPSQKEMLRMRSDFRLAGIVKRMREAKAKGKDGLDELIEAETELGRLADKLDLRSDRAYARGKGCLRDLERAKNWARDLRSWGNRHGTEA